MTPNEARKDLCRLAEIVSAEYGGNQPETFRTLSLRIAKETDTDKLAKSASWIGNIALKLAGRKKTRNARLYAISQLADDYFRYFC